MASQLEQKLHPSADSVRLGHALDHRHDPEGGEDAPFPFVIALTNGEKRLLPRKPGDSEAVDLAEAILEAEPRPVYAYVGDLHPALGTVGLIFARSWAQRALQGVTKCDSGGLAGRRGGFAHLDAEETREALLKLSTPQACTIAGWPSAFSDEVEKSYPEGVQGYVSGLEPEASTWKDERARCLQAVKAGGEKPDRRLWTWEARMYDSPTEDEIMCLVLSPEAFKRLTHVRGASDIPPSVRILQGVISGNKVAHWFSSEEVHEALAGGV